MARPPLRSSPAYRIPGASYELGSSATGATDVVLVVSVCLFKSETSLMVFALAGVNQIDLPF
jgi:hypothetical protein